MHGEFFKITFHYRGVKGERMLYADHVFLIMLLVLPFYALFPHVYTLFLVQAFMAALGAFAIFLLARHQLQNELLATCFSLAYLLYPPLEGSTLCLYTFGFHPENLFPPLFLFAFYFLEKRRYRLFVIFLLLTLMVIETYAILLACVALYVFLTDRRNRTAGALMFCVSVLWFVVATQWIIPYFEQGNAPFYFSALTFLAEATKKPWLYLQLVAPLRKYVLSLLAPVLFLPLLDFPLLATVIPNLAVNLFAFPTGYRLPMNPSSWHVTVLIPIIFLSAISGVRNLLRPIKDRPWRQQVVRYGSLALLGAALFSAYWSGPLPFSRSVEPDRYQVVESKVEALNEVKTLIPEEASLSVTNYLGAHFTQREKIYLFPTNCGKADFVLVDSAPRNWWRPGGPEEPSALARLQESPNHELIYSKNNILLFRKLPELPMQHATEANFSGQIKLLGYTLETEEIKPGDSVQLALYWQALANMETSYTVFTHLIDQDERIMGQRDNLPVSGLYPTTEWTPGEKIVDRYEIATSPEILPGEYSIEIGLYELDSGERLPALNAMGLPQDSRVILSKVWVVDE
ncbi:MAG TPA: DUF2079 domain-containing protein [Anaerolineae bacterium]|nr:DUF2079 domain-containing protein [Anaerolineae bacterium]